MTQKQFEKLKIRNDRRKSKQSGYARIGRVRWDGVRGHGVNVEYFTPNTVANGGVLEEYKRLDREQQTPVGCSDVGLLYIAEALGI